MTDRFINNDINNSRSPIQNKNVCINCSGTFHLVCSLPGNNKPGLRKPNEKHLRHLSEFVSSDPLKPRETSVLIIIYYWIFYPSCWIFFHISCLSVQLTCFPSLRVKLIHVKCTNWASPSVTNTSSSLFQQTSCYLCFFVSRFRKVSLRQQRHRQRTNSSSHPLVLWYEVKTLLDKTKHFHWLSPSVQRLCDLQMESASEDAQEHQ